MQGQQDDPGEDLDGLTGLFGYTERPDERYTRRHPLGSKAGQRQNVQTGRLDGKVPPVDVFVAKNQNGYRGDCASRGNS